MCKTTEKLNRVGIRFNKLTNIAFDKYEILIKNPEPSNTYLARMKLYFNVKSVYKVNNELHIGFSTA